jgi:hypothetical protein
MIFIFDTRPTYADCAAEGHYSVGRVYHASDLPLVPLPHSSFCPGAAELFSGVGRIAKMCRIT